MKIQDVMTKDPATVTPGSTVRDVAQLMKREDTGIVPIIQEGSRQLVGVITDRDIALRVVGEGRNGDTRVSEIMSGDRLATATPQDSVEQVLDTMGREQVRRVPIVDERGDLVGIVSQADMARKAGSNAKVEHAIEEISQPGGRNSQ